MLTSQIINQTPNPIVKIKRLKTDDGEPIKTSTMQYDEKTQVAYDVITGKYGNGETRKAALKADGYDYSEIQQIVKNANGKVENLTKVTVITEEKTYINSLQDIITFSPNTGEKILQSFQFSLSKDDVKGSFNLTFFPDTASGSSVFDLLQKLDIVEIYETKSECATLDKLSFDSVTKKVSGINYSKKPVFIGIIKRKKYVSQMTDTGAIRRLSVSGISVAGLISELHINLDTTAVAISKQIVESQSLNKQFTLDLLGKDKTVKDIVTKLWDSFLNIANACGTVAIKYLIEQTMGSDFFDIDSSVFHYPLANVLQAEQTQDFYSLLTGIIPQPLYEKYAYMDFETGKMKVKIREVPFRKSGDSDCTKGSNGKSINWTSIKNRELSAKEVKAIDLSESDDEVYTVFFSYLSGYPINTDKLMRIIAMEDDKKSDMIMYNEKKYMIYGYRPLIVNFNGYSQTEGEKDTSTESNLAKINGRLAEWFGRLDDMLRGQITLGMTYSYDTKPIMPGEVIGFLGGEFYVEGISHSWTYGASGEISLSVSRGGKYSNTGSFSILTDFTKNIKLLESSLDKKVV